MSYRSIQFSVALLAACLVCQVTRAAIIELEPNDVLADATPIPRVGGNFADVGVARLGGSGGDVDVFSIDLFPGEFVLANTAGIEGTPIGSSPDTIVALVDPSGTIIEYDDDDAQSFGSNFTFEIVTDGTYYIAVSGFGDSTSPQIGQMFGDTSFIGDHTERGNYILTVSVVVPEPATLATVLIALVGVGCLMRRMR